MHDIFARRAGSACPAALLAFADAHDCAQALQRLAQKCCQHGGCEESWQRLADANKRKDVRAAGLALCAGLQLHCTQNKKNQGQVHELRLEASQFQCDVSALAPIQELDTLSALVVGGSGFTGVYALCCGWSCARVALRMAFSCVLRACMLSHPVNFGGGQLR